MVVIITTLYLNDPLVERVVQRLSIGARTPFGLRYAPTISEQLRLLNTTNYPLDTQQLEQSQENENGMETLELDTPSEYSRKYATFRRYVSKFTRLGVMWVNFYY